MVPGKKGQKRGTVEEERGQQQRGQKDTEVSLCHLEVLLLSRGRYAFSTGQELLLTSQKLLELGEVTQPQFLLCEMRVSDGIVISTLAAHLNPPERFKSLHALSPHTRILVSLVWVCSLDTPLFAFL